MVDICLDHIPLIPNGNDLLKSARDALALFANANSELNQRRRELIKPDLHDEYKHLCSSSLAITDQLFGNDLPKQVREFTEVNHVGKKLSMHTGRSTAKPVYHRQVLCAWPWTPRIPALQEAFFRLVEKRPQTSPNFQEEEGGEVNVKPISSNIEAEVRNRLEQTVDIIGGRLKQFASQWQCITSEPFILNSVKHYKIEFEDGEPHQCMPPKEINFTRQEQEVIDVEIDKLLIKGVISETMHCHGEYSSTIFVRPKKDGGHRLTLNLKSLNEHVEYHHFKMDTLQSAIKLELVTTHNNCIRPRPFRTRRFCMLAYFFSKITAKSLNFG